MKFLIDMPLSEGLAHWLRSRGHEAEHVSRLGLGRASDIEIVERARRDQCVILTADLDFPRLLALTRSEKPGLILFRRGDYSEHGARDRLDRALQLVSEEQLRNAIVIIEPDRIRMRKLPTEPS